MYWQTHFANPLAYYCWLRKQGYSPRGAYMSALMLYCPTQEAMLTRLRKRRKE